MAQTSLFLFLKVSWSLRSMARLAIPKLGTKFTFPQGRSIRFVISVLQPHVGSMATVNGKGRRAHRSDTGALLTVYQRGLPDGCRRRAGVTAHARGQ